MLFALRKKRLQILILFLPRGSAECVARVIYQDDMSACLHTSSNSSDQAEQAVLLVGLQAQSRALFNTTIFIHKMESTRSV